jgi:hypothetical protein
VSPRVRHCLVQDGRYGDKNSASHQEHRKHVYLTIALTEKNPFHDTPPIFIFQPMLRFLPY